jgi:hypothetical protein
MSLGNGNPKNGDKGSNFNFELKVLQGLQTIITNGINCCQNILNYLGEITSYTQPYQRYPHVLSTTTTGSIPFCYSFSIANVGSAAGTVNGQALPAGATVNFDASALNNFFSDKEQKIMDYDASGTTFLITYITD